MTKWKVSLLVLCVCSLSMNLRAAETNSLNAHLEPLRPLLGKTWKGVFKDSKPDKPTIDIARWERVLNGQAVRALHSINGGIYGGETMFVWNEKKQTLEYYYFTTAGYMTTGKVEFKNGQLLTHEDVAGDAGGITEVRATSEILPEGKFHVKAEYFKAGQWNPGHEVTYQPASSSEVVFK